jgi:dTDP-4-amino-4,6-dideoxygalactose transaminase
MAENKTLIPFTDLHSQYKDAKKDIDAAIKYCIDGNHFITGPVTQHFEETIATYTGATSCASTGSGSTALLCALLAAGIGPGDEVITTPLSYVSTSEAILQCGATPVYVDISWTYMIDEENISSAITKKTKAILFVDLYGQTPRIEKLKRVAKENNLILIEDAAQSFGATYKGKRVGNLVNLTCFSFNPLKNLGAMGDAGAVTGSKALIDKVKMYRDHGRKQPGVYETMGYNARIDNIQAKILEAKLPYLDKWIEGKRAIVERYNNELIDWFIKPVEIKGSYHTYYVYVVQVPNRKHRDNFIKYMSNNGVQCNIHYSRALTKQPAYKKFANHSCGIAETFAKRIVSLPCYYGLTKQQQKYIIELANKFKDTVS